MLFTLSLCKGVLLKNNLCLFISMMKFVNMFVIGMTQLFALGNSQIMDGGTALIGSSHDNHGCVTDGGYQWCDSLNQCVRPWMTPCPTIAVEPPLIDPGFGVPVNPPVAVDLYPRLQVGNTPVNPVTCVQCQQTIRSLTIVLSGMMDVVIVK